MASTRTVFEERLQQVRQSLLEMAAMADRMLADALASFEQQDESLATSVVRTDDEVDRLDLQIEQECILLIATEAPVARDVRLLGSALKIIADIERIADYAVDIAKIGRRLTRGGLYRPLADLSHLGSLARAMLRDAMSAFVTHDVGLVHKVVDDDAAVDELYHRQRDQLLRLMEQDGKLVAPAHSQLFAAKYLERVGDHAVNVAERVYYVETGEPPHVAKSKRPAPITPEET
jgi:phosphate transport system protein